MAEVKDPGIAIQNSIDATLRNDAGVKAEFNGKTRLYTLTAPNDADFPYIVIGGDQIIGDDTDCASASEIVVTVHVFAREATPAATRLKAKAIAAVIRVALSVILPLEGHEMYNWSFGGTLPLVEPDGLTAHSVLTFTYDTVALP